MLYSGNTNISFVRRRKSTLRVPGGDLCPGGGMPDDRVAIRTEARVRLNGRHPMGWWRVRASTGRAPRAGVPRRTANGLPGTANGLLGTANGLPRTANGLVRTVNGLPRTANDLLRTASDLLRTTNGLDKTVNGFGGFGVIFGQKLAQGTTNHKHNNPCPCP